MRKLAFLVTIFLCVTVWTATACAESATVRIKDIAKVQGVRDNQLVGYGLVAGLAGTGDTNSKSVETMQSIANMLKNFGVVVSPSQVQSANVAAVMVTAQLPPFLKPGDTIDVNIASMGDAKSLQGGVLLQTPLRAADGQVYAVAQGPVSIGGYSVSSGGNSRQKNFPTVGTTPNGGIVERAVPMQFSADGNISLALSQPDFTTANRISEAINNNFGDISTASDPGTVVVAVPSQYQGSNLVGFISDIENLYVRPSNIAKVIINERTGTIVMGANVNIDEVAVAQGGLSIRISKNQSVSQPPPLSGGSTVTTTNTNLQVKEPQSHMMVLPASANVGDVVNALNAVGAKPSDIIAILQAIKAAGALHADLQLM
jgi:flagellar P-ring protein precursor FlgI